jgi:hypothetical protein
MLLSSELSQKASRIIYQGEFIGELTGLLFSKEVLHEWDPGTLCPVIQAGENQFLSPALPFCKWPHSCYPTCVVTGGLNVIARRPIQKGEYFTLDYSSLIFDPIREFRCQCGCNGCRGRISSFTDLPIILQEVYLVNDWVPRALKNHLVEESFYRKIAGSKY